MIPILMCIYVLAFALEVAGGWIVAADILKDRRELRRVLKEQAEAKHLTYVDFGGFTMGGQAGQEQAQRWARQDIVEDFCGGSLTRGQREAMVGYLGHGPGAFMGTVGNVVGTLAGASN